MKHNFTILLLFLSLYAQAQLIDPVPIPVDTSTGAIQFRDVVSVDQSLDTKAIIQKAKSWVATAYRSANDVVQQYDPEAGIIIAKGQFQVNKTSEYRFMGKQTTTIPVTIYETLTIEAKPGRYRVTLSNYELSAGAGGQRVALAANRGTMGKDDYLATVQKYATGQAMERTVMKAAEKNWESALSGERQFMRDIATQSEAILQNLKTHMQKKAEKDW